MLDDGDYMSAFATEAAIGVSVQVFEMKVGLRDKIDPGLIVEQAAASVLSAKINTSKAMKNVPHIVTHSADELADTALGVAVGQKPDFETLAANIAGDEAADGASTFTQHVKHKLTAHTDENENHHSDQPTAPITYADQTKSTHISSFIDTTAAANDPTKFLDDSYADEQKKELARSLFASDEAKYHDYTEEARHADVEAYAHHTTHENFISKLWDETKGAAEFGKDLVENISGFGEALIAQISITPFFLRLSK